MKILSRSNLPLKYIGLKARKTPSGFTLVELLVVISILAILAVITITSINFALASDVTRSASRQVQSYLAGARDRAIYAKAPRGVRFLLDRTGSQGSTISSNRATVTSMVYIAPSEPWSRGTINLERIDESPDDGTADGPDIFEVRGTGTDWKFLYDRGQILENARIKIPDTGSGIWYTINLAASTINSSEEVLRLTTPYRESGTNPHPAVIAFTAGSGPSTYQLELVSEVLPGEEPVLLPNGAAIDLDRSFIPASWRSNLFSPGDDGQPGKSGVDDDGANGNDDAAELGWPGSDDVRLYSSQLDLMFSPRGSVIGREAGSGKIHFAINSIENINSTWLSGTDYAEGDRIQIPARGTVGSYSYTPYDRTYVCKTAGTSGSDPTVFLASGARVDGVSFTTDGSVVWEVEPNTSTILLSLYTRTGSISASQLNVSGIAFDPFKYAETGEVSK
ncbi:hypothetical protein Pan241w_52290 [Gimesia alba]|uniref:Prepilin-type N-terminal cleavage/methylation domain-containing protein n=1 Tax=Gimesia alba TaxID=2527973 RepID=A0A517RMK1_9PLAN|nr:prepilin-type N-terminal cleavage/methylation domain-containing protein [Gimesia alba]QDT45111.1 hypothetical protein Pan241w_52290 [Gimesia alba]